MAFVVSTSLLLLNIEGTAARVLQYMWIPFCVLGVVYAVWRYYTRLNMLQVTVGVSVFVFVLFACLLGFKVF